MLLIKKAEVVFSSGLNVFTGETGAGKSIIFDCLAFIFGIKTRNKYLKDNEKNGQVIAEFQLNNRDDLISFLEDLSIPASETLIIRRVEFYDGRKKSYINDISCTTEVVKILGEKLIEFVDQKNSSNILKKKNHINLLDDFCQNKNLLIEIKKIWTVIKIESKKLSELILQNNNFETEADFKKKSLSELKSLNIKPGEFEKLEVMRNSLKSSSKINEYLSDVYNAISQYKIIKVLTDSVQKLEKTSELLINNKLLDESIRGFNSIINDLGDIENNINTILNEVKSEDFNLEDVEQRLYEVKKISRKHNIHAEELLYLQEELEKQLSSYENFDEEIKSIKKNISKSEIRYDEIANLISSRRKVEGKKLDTIINNELSNLKMEGMRFVTHIQEMKEKKIIGKDDVTFKLTNHNLPIQDIDKVASGGELSRILLALKVSLVKKTSGLALIFDEIDRGIGGATAEAVGNRLLILSKNEQILLVTHSPQVASKAGKHWKVIKKINNEGIPISIIKELNHNDIKNELARMISGKKITKEAIAAAEKLM